VDSPGHVSATALRTKKTRFLDLRAAMPFAIRFPEPSCPALRGGVGHSAIASARASGL